MEEVAQNELAHVRFSRKVLGTFLTAAATILAVEAYHMGMAPSVLYRMGGEAREAANKISDARDTLDGPADSDQGILANGKANIVPSDADGKAFVYLTDKAGVSGGGIFPKGMNGTLRTT